MLEIGIRVFCCHRKPTIFPDYREHLRLMNSELSGEVETLLKESEDLRILSILFTGSVLLDGNQMPKAYGTWKQCDVCYGECQQLCESKTSPRLCAGVAVSLYMYVFKCFRLYCDSE